MINGLAERLAWARAQREWTQKGYPDCLMDMGSFEATP